MKIIDVLKPVSRKEGIVKNRLFHPYVDKEAVVDFVIAHGLSCRKAEMRIIVIKGVLYVKLKATSFHRNLVCNFLTPANAELISALILFMQGDDERIENFLHSKDEQIADVQEEGEDLKVEIFEQFLHSSYHGEQDRNWKVSNGASYLRMNFLVGRNCKVSFCIKKTDEVVYIMDKAFLPR